jgi:hypothetical protein
MNHRALAPRASLTSRFALCLALLAPLATGCIADAGADLGEEALGEAVDALGPPPPATCQEIRAAHPTAGDGLYTLFVEHDPAKPWKAHCHDMAGTPAEYLNLKVGPSVNFSQYTAGGAVSGTNVRTRYGKIRIDPETLEVDISDQTFSTSSGSLVHGGETVTSMPFGVAMSCDATDSGVGNIDLTGTPFAVATGEFLQGGAGSSGSSVYSSDDRVVDLTGGGFCGWTCASPATFNPFNDAGDFQLALVYAP